jgi:hypothetical protein
MNRPRIKVTTQAMRILKKTLVELPKAPQQKKVV